jgi:hypothetical protein
MERWRVPDATALELIEFPGKLGASGKRPGFRFTTRQQRITSYLPEIDAALAAAGKDQAWLHRKIQGRSRAERSAARPPQINDLRSADQQRYCARMMASSMPPRRFSACSIMARLWPRRAFRLIFSILSDGGSVHLA